jgi:hypothetical protein
MHGGATHLMVLLGSKKKEIGKDWTPTVHFEAMPPMI